MLEGKKYNKKIKHFGKSKDSCFNMLNLIVFLTLHHTFFYTFRTCTKSVIEKRMSSSVNINLIT